MELNIETEQKYQGYSLWFINYKKDCCWSSLKLDFRSLLKDEIINDKNKVRPEARDTAKVSKKNIPSLQEKTHLSPRPESVSGVGKKKKKEKSLPWIKKKNPEVAYI